MLAMFSLYSTVNGGETSPKPKLTLEPGKKSHQQPILKDLAVKGVILIKFAVLQ